MGIRDKFIRFFNFTVERNWPEFFDPGILLTMRLLIFLICFWLSSTTLGFLSVLTLLHTGIYFNMALLKIKFLAFLMLMFKVKWANCQSMIRARSFTGKTFLKSTLNHPVIKWRKITIADCCFPCWLKRLLKWLQLNFP